ncbi:MAG: FHA domain-containing protein, partial [Spirochaetaceae bacterium]
MKTFIVALPSGKQHPVTDERIIVGRNPESGIMMTDDHVSRIHCVIYKKNNMYYIEDLGSSNGTFVNGEKIENSRKLYNNDTISLGQKTAAFQFRRDILTFRQITQVLKKPAVFFPAIATVFLVAGLLFYFGFLRNLGKIDIDRGLDRLRTTYGQNAIPDNPEFRQALERAVETVQREYNDDELMQRMRKYRPSIDKILKDNNLPSDYSFI